LTRAFRATAVRKLSGRGAVRRETGKE
jgi:hypothetical protein